MNNIYLLLFLLTLTLFILGMYYNSKILKVLSLVSCLSLVILFALDIKNKNILNDTTEYEWSSPESTIISISPVAK
jgi:hypothetical protein